MKTIILPVETRATTGFNRKLILTFADLATWTSGTAQAVIPANALGAATVTMLANTRTGRWICNVVTAFTSSGGTITSLGLSVGDGGSATRFLSSVDLKTAGMTLGTVADYLYTAADTIDATATIVGQTMASLNAGVVEIYYDEVDINALAAVQQP